MTSRAERRALQEQQRKHRALGSMTTAATEMLLIRHGETPWNVSHRLQGQLMPGPGLTDRGRRQAEMLAERLQQEQIDCIYSSDLLRATETAAVVAAWRRGSAALAGDGPAAFQTDARLRERHLGALQGLTLAEAEQQQPAAFAALQGLPAGPQAPADAPETVEQLDARVAAALEDLAKRHPGQRLLIVTHGGFLQAAYRRAAGSHCGRNANAAINTLRIEAAGRQRGTWAVVRWGDRDHLGGVGSLAGAFGGGSAG